MTLDTLKEICTAATQGTWHIGHVSEHFDYADVDCEGITVAHVMRREDQGYLCAFSPDTVAKLLTVASKARGYLEIQGSCSSDIYQVGRDLEHALDALEEL